MPPSFPPKKWITFPVDVAARDLDSRIVMSCAAVRRGFNAIVGSYRAVDGGMPDLPRGIFVIPNVDHDKRQQMETLKAYGYRVVCLDEEAFMAYSDEFYSRNRLSPYGMEQLEYFLVPSPNTKRIVTAAMPQATHKIVETGNARVDLLRPELRTLMQPLADERRRRFGHFILINTNLSINNFFDDEMVEHMRTIAVGGANDDDRAWYKGKDEYEQKLFRAFQDMIRHLGREMADVPIIIRPHPAEDMNQWRAFVTPFPNIQVIHEGSVHSWALASAAVVHNSCTTGVESHLLGRTVIAYRPMRSDRFDLWLPNAVSEEVTDLPSLVARLRRAVDDSRQGVSRFERRETEAIETHFGPLDGPFAFQRIMDVIARVEVEPEPFPTPRFPSAIAKENLKEAVRLCAQRLPRLGLAVFGKPHMEYWQFDYQKVPTLSLDTIRTRVQALGRAHADLAGVDVRLLGRNIFAFTAAGAPS